MVSLSSFPTVSPLQSPHQVFRRRSVIPPLPDRLWEIKQGVVRTLTWDEDGKVISLGVWGIGDLVGAPLSQVEHYHIECLTDVEVRGLSRREWERLTEQLLQHARQSERLLTIVRHDRIRDRVLDFLDWLSVKFGCPVPGGRRINLQLSHRIIAEILGTSRVTVTRTLRQLEEEGHLHRQRRGWILCDRPVSFPQPASLEKCL